VMAANAKAERRICPPPSPWEPSMCRVVMLCVWLIPYIFTKRYFAMANS
jgi:hypothetical protein